MLTRSVHHGQCHEILNFSRFSEKETVLALVTGPHNELENCI